MPDYGTYTGYIVCDMAILGLKNAGKNPTRQGFVDGIRKTNGGQYDSAGLMCKPLNLSYENFGKVDPQSCLWYVTVKDGKFKVFNGGKTVPASWSATLRSSRSTRATTGGVTTTAPPATVAP